ncbi:MAG: putative branched-chain amino acid transport ATP-binding protein LivG [Methanoregula sp. PtaU1.Bin051]|nr:MAG: putative branched-chain amino acid transport ATP-binding protein LivG [Methanoregula sp. PtaU1.Bin051]
MIKELFGSRRRHGKKSSTGVKEQIIPPLLEFENVTVVKGATKLLDSISLTIAEGENVAILGPNGAGKSSLIKTINREYYPVSSHNSVIFRVRGKENWDVFDLRSAIGIVSNDLQSAFTRDLPVREVVISGFFSSVGLFMHKVTPQMEERADGLMEFLGVSHLAGRSMTSLSSGEAKRVLIARALVHEPKTLILDEPTTSLDLSAQHIFRSTLRKIAGQGTGIIMATHNLHDIIPEISRVILMKDGRFAADGPKHEILTDRKVGGLFGVPVHVKEEDGWYYATGY